NETKPQIPTGASSDNSAPAKSSHVAGMLAAKAACGTCHLVPDPSMLDKRTWEKELLPKMFYFASMAPPITNVFKDIQYVLAADILPKAPMMSQKTWDEVCDYYISSAPEKMEALQDESKFAVGLKQFTVVPAQFRRGPPHTTLVKIDPTRHLIMMGDA